MATTPTTFIGKHKGHIITGTFQTNPEGGKPLFKIEEWTTPDGKAAPKKAGLIGKTFKSAGIAGVAAYAALHEHFGTPERLEGRHLTFNDADGVSAANKAKALTTPEPKKAKAEKSKTVKEAAQPTGKKSKSAKSAKASKKSAPVVEEDEDEDDDDEDFELPELEAIDEADEDDAPVVKKVGKGSKVAAAAVATKKSKKSKKPAKTPTAESYSIFQIMEDGRGFCAACMEAFDYDGNDLPDECPQGHTTANFRDMLSS